MDHKDLNLLLDEAGKANGRDDFISEWTTSSLFDPYPDGPEPDYPNIVAELGRIYDLAHTSIRELRKGAQLTQAAFAERFAIPRRTVEDWEAGRRHCPPYLLRMIARELHAFPAIPLQGDVKFHVEIGPMSTGHTQLQWEIEERVNGDPNFRRQALECDAAFRELLPETLEKAKAGYGGTAVLSMIQSLSRYTYVKHFRYDDKTYDLEIDLLRHTIDYQEQE